MHDSDLMEQLLAFCEKKVNEMEIKTHVSPTKTHNIQESSHRSTGRQMKDFKETSAKLQLSHEFPTTYIDLRSSTCPTKQSAISPANTEKGMSSTKRMTNTNVKASVQKREFAGKSLLLKNIRQSKQSGTEMTGSWGNPQDFADARQKNSSGKIIKEIELHAFKTIYSKPGIQQVNVCSSAKYDQNEHISQSSHVPDAQNKQSHKVKCQKDLKFLQTFRPQRSASNCEEAAERTDILYDPEASYLPSVNTLPADLQMRECLLLTVSLSSLGVVAGRMQRKAKTVNSVFIKSHVYNALIAWFLSLTDPNCNRKSNNLDAPFWVAGLQQFYKEDGLALYICAMSLEDGQTGFRESRMGKVEKDENMFYRRVCKFFAQTSLKSVAFWVPQLNQLLEEQTYSTHVHMPSSYLDCFISVNPNIEAVEKAFSVIPGFYWQTLETEDQKCQRTEATNSQECHTETALVLVGSALFLNPLAMHHTLELMCGSSLDVCGIRFLYPPQELLINFTGTYHIPP
ncbi:dynein axonemal assembly factor 8-like [Pseudorasbora parva]|uniref:dynein axonemal assembly factor 8-like n=1 Tax=Pseudorasbora parva TaxID=51549 RepID=UPI00351DBB8F